MIIMVIISRFRNQWPFSGSEINGPFHANLQPDLHDVPHLPLVRLSAGDHDDDHDDHDAHDDHDDYDGHFYHFSFWCQICQICQIC